METLRFRYHADEGAQLGGLLLFLGTFSAAFFYLAVTNHRGLVIRHAIHLAPVIATTIYWSLAVVTGLIVILSVPGLIQALGQPGEVMVDDAGLTAPGGFAGRRRVTVPFETIREVEYREVGPRAFLIVHHDGGKLTISRGMLPSPQAFDTLMTILDARTRRPRARG